MGLARSSDGWRAGRDRGAGWLGRGGASGRGEQAAQGWAGARQVEWEERGEDQGEGGEGEREEVEGGGHFKRGCGVCGVSVHSEYDGGQVGLGAGEGCLVGDLGGSGGGTDAGMNGAGRTKRRGVSCERGQGLDAGNGLVRRGCGSVRAGSGWRVTGAVIVRGG